MLPTIPKSITFTRINPFFSDKTEEMNFNTSPENIIEEPYYHLDFCLDKTIMNTKKNKYFNQKIFDFNQNKKDFRGFLSDESRVSSFFQIKSPNSNIIDNKTSISERIPTGFSYFKPKKELINDGLDFLHKMHNFDLLEDEFLHEEQQEFQRNPSNFTEIINEIAKETSSQNTYPDIFMENSRTSS